MRGLPWCTLAGHQGEGTQDPTQPSVKQAVLESMRAEGASEEQAVRLVEGLISAGPFQVPHVRRLSLPFTGNVHVHAGYLLDDVPAPVGSGVQLNPPLNGAGGTGPASTDLVEFKDFARKLSTETEIVCIVPMSCQLPCCSQGQAARRLSRPEHHRSGVVGPASWTDGYGQGAIGLPSLVLPAIAHLPHRHQSLADTGAGGQGRAPLLSRAAAGLSVRIQ